ncbi:hypothetical protein FGO68_gene12705 [Halteria grandinella]|uniref:ACB domain-containing protein n=1 Tax=Halteria grandinella TaxID=5974 RepID=A0A8J8NHD4_HALGN|nr:hypothetical protein FGO68_gene12705 [Halteria grandinella]
MVEQSADQLNEEFERYVKHVQEHKEEMKKSQPRELLLSVYAHGRQGKLGDNNDPKPGMLDIAGKMKYKAYANLKGMDQTEAKKKFLELAKGIFGELKQ